MLELAGWASRSASLREEDKWTGQNSGQWFGSCSPGVKCDRATLGEASQKYARGWNADSDLAFDQKAQGLFRLRIPWSSSRGGGAPVMSYQARIRRPPLMVTGRWGACGGNMKRTPRSLRGEVQMRHQGFEVMAVGTESMQPEYTRPRGRCWLEDDGGQQTGIHQHPQPQRACPGAGGNWPGSISLCCMNRLY